jgi:hypothetical protein
MPKTNAKTAVFVAGPYRYVNLVNRQLERVFKDRPYDCFYHMWIQDLGNKQRASEYCDLDSLRKHPRTKALILSQPYSEDDFHESIGIHTNSNSKINASMGMFISMSILCNFLEQLPDFEAYGFILRMRTDCAILNDNFVEKLIFDHSTLTVSRNYWIPTHWLSDHIHFGCKDIFFSIWKHNAVDEIYQVYTKGKRNPERTLAHLFNCIKKNVRLNPSLRRYTDYHIVHDPPKADEPTWIAKAISAGGVPALFNDPTLYCDPKDMIEFRKRAEAQQRIVTRETRLSRKILRKFKSLRESCRP